MRFMTAFAFVAAVTVCIAGEISVSDVEIKQDISTRIVTVSYTLGANPAIVTVDFLTNSVSIGEENFSNVKGDVNRLVTGGGDTRLHGSLRSRGPTVCLVRAF